MTEAVSSIQGEESQDDWRWGVRVTPMLNLLALILLMFFMLDPPRGMFTLLFFGPFHVYLTHKYSKLLKAMNQH